MRVVRVLVVGAVLALLGLLVWDVAKGGGDKVAKKVDQGKVVPAPAFRLPLLNGDGHLALASLRGKVVVLNFWQSYCPPCREEAPDLVAAHEHWSARGVVFVGVDVQDFKGAARKFLAKYGVEYTIVRDGPGSTIGPFGLTGYPETFFVDRRGRVVPPHIVGIASREELDAGIRRALRSA
jgi:cytochrome c biogenesis protein CcmG, thiol:disulfide interchange protein DsbE